MKKKMYGAGFGILLIVFWQLLAMLIDRNFILPTPVRVFTHLKNNFVKIMTVDFPITMEVVLIGCVIAIILGIGFAVLMTLSRPLEKAVYPLLTISQTIPTVCMTPIFVMWFGYTTTTRVIVVVLMTFFSITVNVFDGFQAVSKDGKELLKTYGASPIQEFFFLKVPTALPYLFTALKVSIPWAVVAAAVAEYFGAPGGLGSYSKERMMSLDAAGLLAPLVVISVTALLITVFIKFLEKHIITWGGEQI